MTLGFLVNAWFGTCRCCEVSILVLPAEQPSCPTLAALPRAAPLLRGVHSKTCPLS